MRWLLGGTGLLTLLICWLGPLPQLARSAFFAHMTMHMVVVAVAAPLLALAIAGSRFDPVTRAPNLLAPIPASMLELLVVWSWHAPGLHWLARHGGLGWGLVAEQTMFLFSGLLVWLSAFGGCAPRRAARSAAGIIGLLLTSMHMTLLGALLIFAPRPLYEHTGQLQLLTPLADQHLGGAIMLAVGGISYLAGGLALTVRLVIDPAVETNTAWSGSRRWRSPKGRGNAMVSTETD